MNIPGLSAAAKALANVASEVGGAIAGGGSPPNQAQGLSILDVLRGEFDPNKIVTRDHRTENVPSKAGFGTNWLEKIKTSQGRDELFDALTNPQHPQHESASKFLDDEKNQLAVNRFEQKDNRRFTLLAQMQDNAHRTLTTILQKSAV